LRIAAYTDSRAVGGAEHALAHLIESLGDRVEVSYIGTDESVAKAIAPGREVTIVRPPNATAPDPQALREHVRVLRTARPDLLHANLISPFSCQYALAAAIVLRIPSIAVYQLPNSPANRLQAALKRLTARWTTAHVGVGQRTSREIERVIGLARNSVLTIHNGVPDLAPPSNDHPARTPTIGAIGRLAAQKGFDVLLRALVDVPGARLVIVGDGEERGRLEALARELGIADRTSFPGWTEEPRRLLADFDVFALPSRFEGFPLSILEAQLAEVPIVATDVGSVREAVVPDETGLLVAADQPEALAEALDALVGDPERRRRLGRAGREHVLARFTATHMARAFERLYEELTR
jgi:glycosyltransferase involved in cell wall biosynthesis